jgi:uncharacterized MAPEG superfamily protein
MTVELRMLAYSILLGLAHVLLAGFLSTRQRGVAWNAGNRDAEMPALTGVAARTARASANFLETFPFFAAAALGVVVAHLNSATTALGAQMYFWARLAYLPVYTIGIAYLRTAIWVVALLGLLQVVRGFF